MRALGPGSVSSFLKIILDVTYFALWVIVAVVGAVALGALLLSFNPDWLNDSLKMSGQIDNLDTLPKVAVTVIAATLYLTGFLLIVGQLRRIFATLTAGDPFHPDNVGRLRAIGIFLAALELGSYLYWGVARHIVADAEFDKNGMNLTSWFSVLVVFVLAEVFREGARLRSEAELTI